MEQVSFFLEKFKSLGLNSLIAKSVFIEAVEKILKVKISAENIELKNDTFFVKAHPTLKSELYMKREVILNEVYKNLGFEQSKKIR